MCKRWKEKIKKILEGVGRVANKHRKFNRTTEVGVCGRMGTAEEVTAYGPEIHL